jgi:hypothetical protein
LARLLVPLLLCLAQGLDAGIDALLSEQRRDLIERDEQTADNAARRLSGGRCRAGLDLGSLETALDVYRYRDGGQLLVLRYRPEFEIQRLSAQINALSAGTAALAGPALAQPDRIAS